MFQINILGYRKECITHQTAIETKIDLRLV